jgi:molybdopterin/thiamine biosynthesis adenylyltransferase
VRPEAVERYARHLVLKEIGGPGQQALLAARVAIVGAGGLGGPAGLYLAAAGIGQMTFIDDDVVEASNLQRQVQFTSADIGKSKAGIMAAHLPRLNPDVKTKAVQARLTGGNAQPLLSGHDLVLSGVDNFESRFAINDACLALALPHVSGALGRFDGQVSTFGGKGTGPCYRCFVPEAPPQAESCAQAGIVGALAGIIGSFMALEAIKLLTGAGEPLIGRVWIYDGLRATSRTVSLPRDENCPACGAALGAAN